MSQCVYRRQNEWNVGPLRTNYMLSTPFSAHWMMIMQLRLCLTGCMAVLISRKYCRPTAMRDHLFVLKWHVNDSGVYMCILKSRSSLGNEHILSLNPGRAFLRPNISCCCYHVTAEDFLLPSTISQKTDLLWVFQIFSNQMLRTRFSSCNCWIDQRAVKNLKLHFNLALNLLPIFVFFYSCL